MLHLGFRTLYRQPSDDDKSVRLKDETTHHSSLSVVDTGNLLSNDRVSLFFMDYPNRRRLKLMARTEVFDAADRSDLLPRLARTIHEHAPQTSQPAGFAGLSAPDGTLRVLASSTTRSGSTASPEPAKHRQEPSCCVWSTSS